MAGILAQKEFNKKKSENFSEWYNTIIYAADLADIRYNIQGFVVNRPWAMRSFKKMYALLEKELEKDAHEPISFPTVIPEENFEIEKEHAEGFSAEVWWVTHKSKEKLARKLALRPTSETAFYQMYKLWLQSPADLPYKLYQSCTVFRAEKETNPFMRGCEFMWIETHDMFATEKQAREQINTDIKIMRDVVEGQMAMPFYLFKRPHWDKFAGGEETYAFDTRMPDGKAFQFATTHLLGQNFTKAFDVKYKNAEGTDEYPFTTCFGPGIWRFMAALVSLHGDDKGLIFPWSVAPVQIVIVPIYRDEETKVKLLKKCDEIKDFLQENGISVACDYSEKTPGFKFNHWELRGVPLRIEMGGKELAENKLTVSRRDNREKTQLSASLTQTLLEELQEIGGKLTNELYTRASKELTDNLADCHSKEEVVKALNNKKYARAPFCSAGASGANCAAMLQEFTKGGKVRGTLFEKKEVPKATDKCIECNKKATALVYIARQY